MIRKAAKVIRLGILIVLTVAAVGTGALLAFILSDGSFERGHFSSQYSCLRALAIGGYLFVDYTGPERTLWPDTDFAVGPIQLEMWHQGLGDGLGFPRGYSKARMILIITSHTPSISCRPSMYPT